jgi:hypothetical protein
MQVAIRLSAPNPTGKYFKKVPHESVAHYDRDSSQKERKKGALVRQSELYLDVLGNRKLRYLPHRPVVRLDVNEPSVNPELPVVERVGTLARGGFPCSDLKFLRWKRLQTYALDPGRLCNLLDLPGKPLQLLKVGSWSA